MKKNFNLRHLPSAVFGLFHLISVSFAQQPVPASPQTKSILLMNGVAHIGNGKVIQNSVVGFKEGKIMLVADATVIKIDPSKFDTIIHVSGKHIYPGFIAPNSTLGLVEIEAVRATRDLSEIGSMNPEIRSIIAYNTDSKITPTVRTNGVLLAQITPRGGFISGTSSIVELDGWNWEDAVYKIDDGVHMNWPLMLTRNWTGENPGMIEKSKNYDSQVDDAKKIFRDAAAYNETETHEEKNLRFEAMKGIFKGTQTLFIHANYVKEMSDAIHFSRQMNIKKIVLVGGKDSWMIADLLKENNVAVIVSRLHDLPDKPEDDIDQPFKLPYLLQKAGVLFCLNNEGDMEEMGTRNLPFYAGTAAAYGLTKEEALMSITANTAKILGIDDKVGTLMKGMDATLFISSGDALDMRTNNIEKAFIRGKAIDLNNEQKALYEKYKKKYGLN